MEQLREFYAQTTKKSFLTMAITIMVLCDVLIFTYIYVKFNNPEFFQTTLGMSLSMNGLSHNDLDPSFITNLYHLFHRALIISIALAAFYHLLNYFFWYKGKHFATAYARFLSMIGGPLLILWGFSLLSGGSNLGLLFLIAGAALFALLPGIRHHFPS